MGAGGAAAGPAAPGSAPAAGELPGPGAEQFHVDEGFVFDAGHEVAGTDVAGEVTGFVEVKEQGIHARGVAEGDVVFLVVVAGADKALGVGLFDELTEFENAAGAAEVVDVPGVVVGLAVLRIGDVDEDVRVGLEFFGDEADGAAHGLGIAEIKRGALVKDADDDEQAAFATLGEDALHAPLVAGFNALAVGAERVAMGAATALIEDGDGVEAVGAVVVELGDEVVGLAVGGGGGAHIRKGFPSAVKTPLWMPRTGALTSARWVSAVRKGQNEGKLGFHGADGMSDSRTGRQSFFHPKSAVAARRASPLRTTSVFGSSFSLPNAGGTGWPARKAGSGALMAKTPGARCRAPPPRCCRRRARPRR